jgi:hypothetical protein
MGGLKAFFSTKFLRGGREGRREEGKEGRVSE